jgi:hypothetical protein
MQNIAASLVPVISEPVLINRPTTVLTHRGIVTVQVIRLEQALQELPGPDRAFVLDMLRELLTDVTS